MSKTKLTPFAQAIAASRWPYALSALLVPGLALASPVGGNITGGTAAISVPDATHTVINQTSNSAVIQWQSFNVGQQEYVIFNQPSASAAVLNRVVGGDASTILGHLQSNGRVFLVNPFGVFFGPGAKVDVGSLMASTLDIADQDFLHNKFVFKAPSGSSGGVVNQGNITAGNGGFVVLAGDYVKNAGVITAKLGDVVLASGSAATLNLDGNGLVNVVVNQAALSEKAGVENVGQIAARGGTVVMTARVARELMQAAVNNTGTISAQGIAEKGGDIYLTATGGNIANSGTLDTGGHNGNDAGDILIQADRNILLAATSKLDFTGRSGGVTHVIADRDLTLAKGGTIDGRSTDLVHGHGGFAELSSHGKFLLGSLPTLGEGGTLLIDPDVIDVYGGSSSNCITTTGTLCLSDIDLSAMVTSQNTQLVAGGHIFFEENVNVVSTTAGNGLLVGIGQVSGGNFVRSAPVSGYGGDVDFFNNGSDAFATVNIGGKLEIYSGLGNGSVSLGNFTAGSLHVEAANEIFASNVTVNVGGGALELKSENSYVSLYRSTLDFGSAVIEGDFVSIEATKLTGDALTLIGNSSNEDAIHVYGGSTVSGRALHLNALNGGVQIGNQYSSGYGDEATFKLDSGGELIINAAQGSIDHATITSSSYGGPGGAITVNADNFFDVSNSDIGGTTATFNARSTDGNGNAIQFLSANFQVSQRLEVNAGNAIEISDSFVHAPEMVLNSGSVIGVQFSTLGGNTLSVSTGGDGVFTNTDTQGPPQTIASFISEQSYLQFSKSIAINAGGAAELYGGVLFAGNFNQQTRQATTTEPPPRTPPVGDVVLHAAGSIGLGNGIRIAGDRLTVITAGVSSGSNSQTTDLALTLGDASIGSLTGYTLLIGRDGVAEDPFAESGPRIDGKALDVAGRYIHLGNSNITVDDGAAVQGHDDFVLGLIAQHEPSLLPSTAQPNAAFVAQEDVALGTVNFINGHYMFVRAGQAQQLTQITPPGGGLRATQIPTGSGFTFGNLNYDTSLLLNYTPADPTQNISLDPNLASSAPGGVTLMLGGSTYLGDITVATAPVDAVNGQNFIFATQGSVVGAEFLKTAPSARVLVLDHITFGSDAATVAAQADDSIKVINSDTNTGDAASEVGNSPIEYSNQKDDGKSLECT